MLIAKFQWEIKNIVLRLTMNSMTIFLHCKKEQLGKNIKVENNSIFNVGCT